MRLIIQLLAAGLLLSACANSPKAQSSTETATSEKPIDSAMSLDMLTQGHTEFAFDLYKKLSANPDKDGENIFISPLSISTAFGLAYAGAKGETAKEMASVLHYTLPEAQLHPAMGTLINSVENETEDQLFQMANALFVNQDTVLEPDYLTLTKVAYKTDETRVNFKTHPKQTIETINKVASVALKSLNSELGLAGDATIHYQYNLTTGRVADIKITHPPKT